MQIETVNTGANVGSADLFANKRKIRLPANGSDAFVDKWKFPFANKCRKQIDDVEFSQCLRVFSRRDLFANNRLPANGSLCFASKRISAFADNRIFAFASKRIYP